MRVTSAEVAAEAGVSRATVSYVLNNTPHQTIPEHTREKVLEAARRLGYAPSAAARTLRRGRSDVVLLVLPAWPIGHAVGSFLDILRTHLAEHGLMLVAHQIPAGQALGDLWRAVAPAAVVVLGGVTDSDAEVMQAARVPAIFVDGGDGPLAEWMREVGRIQAKHLMAAGHRRIGYAMPHDPRLEVFAAPRLDGVRAVCADHGLAPPRVQAVSLSEVPSAAVAAWRGDEEPVTAICAYNDEVAIAVLAALREDGLRVPDDVAVIGVDDIPVARFAVPPLTSINVGQRPVAEHVGDAVVRALAGQQPPAFPDAQPAELVVRSSTLVSAQAG